MESNLPSPAPSPVSQTDVQTTVGTNVQPDVQPGHPGSASPTVADIYARSRLTGISDEEIVRRRLADYPHLDSPNSRREFTTWLVGPRSPFDDFFLVGRLDSLEAWLPLLRQEPQWRQIALLNAHLAEKGRGQLPWKTDVESVCEDFRWSCPPPCEKLSKELLAEELCEDLLPRFVKKYPEFLAFKSSMDSPHAKPSPHVHPLGILGLRLLIRHLSLRGFEARAFLLALPDRRSRRAVLTALTVVNDLPDSTARKAALNSMAVFLDLQATFQVGTPGEAPSPARRAVLTALTVVNDLPDSTARKAALNGMAVFLDLQATFEVGTPGEAPSPARVVAGEFLQELRALAAVNRKAIVEFVDDCCENLELIYRNGSTWRVKSLGVLAAPAFNRSSRKGKHQQGILDLIRQKAGVGMGTRLNSIEQLLRRCGVLVARQQKKSDKPRAAGPRCQTASVESRLSEGLKREVQQLDAPNEKPATPRSLNHRQRAGIPHQDAARPAPGRVEAHG